MPKFWNLNSSFEVVHLGKKPKPETIIASPDAMIAEPVRPRTDSRNNDGRSRRPQKILVHQKAEVRPVSKVKTFSRGEALVWAYFFLDEMDNFFL